MPKQRQPTNKSSGELMPTLSVLDRIDWNLRDQLRTFPSKGAVEPEEFEHWHQDLGHFPIAAINFAFDSHRRNGNFFPVYGQIIDLCIAWQPPEDSSGRYAPGCSKECAARHGRGYHQNDIKWLYDAYVAKRQEVNRPLNKTEILALFDRLDKLRGKPPDWRKPA